MYPNYTPPSLIISNTLEVVTARSRQRLGALVVGPRYNLARYGKESIPGREFNASGQNLDFATLSGTIETALPATQTVDANSVTVHGEALEARLAYFDGTGATAADSRFYLPDVNAPHILRMGTTGSHDNVKGSDLATLLRGRAVTVGDIAYITAGGETRRRTVVGLRGVAVPSQYGSNAGSSDGLIANAASNPANQASDVLTGVSLPAGWAASISSGAFAGNLQGPSYNGAHGDLFTLTVITGGAPGVAQVSLSSASGLYTSASITTSDSSGNFLVAGVAGCTVLLDPPSGTTTLTVGQTFKFSIIGVYERMTSTQFVLSGTYTGAKNTTYAIRVKTGTTGDTATNAQLEIWDTTGLEALTTVTVTNGTPFNIGALGLQGTITLAGSGGGKLDNGGLRKGDVFTVVALAESESTSDFDRVIFDAAAINTTVFSDPSTAVVVDFRKVFTGRILATAAADGTAWTAQATRVVVDSGLALFVAERSSGYQWVAYVTGVGKLFAGYRALVAASPSDDVFEVGTLEQITAAAGKIDPENDLAYGLKEALLGAGEGILPGTVWGLNTGGTTLEAYSAALIKTERKDDFAYLAFLDVNSLPIKQLAAQHARAMSGSLVDGAYTLNFRKTYSGIDSPGSYKLLGLDGDGQPYNATVTSQGSGFLLVTHNDADLDFTLLGLAAGDLFKLVVSGVSYPIASVLSRYEILLSSGPNSAVSPAQAFELWKADTVASQKAYLQEIAGAVNSEFHSIVWAENGTILGTDGLVQIPSRFAACRVAGQRSSYPAQQGLSGLTVGTYTAVPATHIRYRASDLNAIAAAGIMVIAQDSAGTLPYNRHQVTTRTDAGILYFEDNPLAVMHALSFALKDKWLSVKGRINNTRRARTILLSQLNETLEASSKEPEDAAQAESLASVGALIEGYADASVLPDPNLKDWINITANVDIAVAGNVIRVSLNGFADIPA